MQRTNSEYGSPYLATHHFPFPFFPFSNITPERVLLFFNICTVDFIQKFNKSVTFLLSILAVLLNFANKNLTKLLCLSERHDITELIHGFEQIERLSDSLIQPLNESVE